MNRIIGCVTMILVLFQAISADRVIVILEDGGERIGIPDCKVTIYDDEDLAVFSGYSNNEGRIWIRGLPEGSYLGVLQITNMLFSFIIDIDNNPELVDTILISAESE